MSSMAAAAAPLAAPVKPVPKMASTTTSAISVTVTTPGSASPAALNPTRGSIPRRCRISRFRRASPLYSSGSASVTTVTSTPASRSSRATTNPSPPLLPLPQKTTASSGS